MNDRDIEKLQIDLDRLGERAVENAMKKNPGKGKAGSLTTARAKESPSYFGGNKNFRKRKVENI
jgi:hypothetical protein